MHAFESAILPFASRTAAGHALAACLMSYRDQANTVVLALPRGGVPVAVVVAAELSLPLDLILVRKLGTPGQEELAMGALTSDHVVLLNEELIHRLRINEAAIAAEIQHEQHELARRELRYRGDRQALAVTGKTVILIDDGIATGFSMQAAIAAVRSKKPLQIIVAVPVAAQDSIDALEKLADRIYCLQRPAPFHAIGLWYQDFAQLTDEAVTELLQQAWSSQR